MASPSKSEPHHVGPVPAIDRSILVAFWDRHIASEVNDAKVFDFGPYATLPKSCAVRGSALARLAPMLEQFLMVVPSCRACKKEMQNILLERINTSRRKLNTTSRLNEDVARAIASAFSVVHSHARRLKNEKLFAQPRASCKDGEDVAILDGLRESCKGTSSGVFISLQRLLSGNTEAKVQEIVTCFVEQQGTCPH